MKDFYARKLAVFERLENTIRTATIKGKAVNEDLLYSEVNRATGFTTVAKKRVEELIELGQVKRELINGLNHLLWVELPPVID